MRYHVISETQPRAEVQNVYAQNSVHAAEIIAKVHGLLGVFKVKEQDSPTKSWVHVTVNRSWEYEGKYSG